MRVYRDLSVIMETFYASSGMLMFCKLTTLTRDGAPSSYDVLDEVNIIGKLWAE